MIKEFMERSDRTGKTGITGSTIFMMSTRQVLCHSIKWRSVCQRIFMINHFLTDTAVSGIIGVHKLIPMKKPNFQ